MPITALPVLNRFSATFKTDVDTFFGSQMPTFCTEANTLQTDVNAKQVTASAAAVDAAAQVTLATTQATNAALSATSAASSALTAGAVAWVSGTTYAIGNARFSPANGQTYRRLTAGAGTTDPSADATNWIVINGLTSEAIPLPANNLPTARPTLNLNFASSQTVDPRITFTRASTATRVNSKGLIEAVVSGVPRIDYDPVTGACKGLLIEEARTNLLTYSEQFDNAAWTKTRSSISANATASPDGTTTADKMVEDATASSSHEAIGSATVVASTVYTYSIFAKADTRSIFVATLSGVFSTAQSIAFTLIGNGTVTVLGGTSAGAITALPNGWYRCTVTTVPAPSSGSALLYTYLATAATIPGISYTGDGISGLFIWGAQLEAGAFPTSYIPTVASQVTRAADAASMTGTNFSSWYRQDEGSFVAGSVIDNVTKSGRIFCVDDGSTSNQLDVTAAGNQFALETVVSGAYASAGASSTFSTGTVIAAVAYRNDSTFENIAVNGVNNTGTSIAIPVTLSNLRIGHQVGGTAFSNRHIARLTYYPERLSNAQLQALSTQ